MRLAILFLASVVALSVSCRSAEKPAAKTAGAIAAVKGAGLNKAPGVVSDYTADWRKIADLAGTTEYDPYITYIVWRRLNWRDYLSGRVFLELATDMEREYRWEKRIRDWEAKKEALQPEGESGEDSDD